MFTSSMTKEDMERIIKDEEVKTGYSADEIVDRKLSMGDLELYEKVCKQYFGVEVIKSEHLKSMHIPMVNSLIQRRNKEVEQISPFFKGLF